MKRCFALALIVILTMFTSIIHAQSNGVSDARFARLAKGVNITRWFWLEDIQSKYHYENYFSDHQLQQIRDAGFTHVRLPIEPASLLDPDHPAPPDAELLAFIKSAAERINSHDLAVIIDIHNWQEDFNDRLMSDPDMQQAFINMWQTIATDFSDTDPNMVFFEVMNEPEPDDPSLWPPIQEKVVKAIRQAAPEHTIIVGGADWNSIDGLKLLKPLDDPNLVYNFHFYDPFVFTHQGADWVKTVKYLHDLPYPSTDGRCGTLPDFGDKKANASAKSYCTDDTWDAARIDQRIQEAVDWAAQYNVRLTCNEFGATSRIAQPDDRFQWFADVRAILEKYNIGWTIWGYDEGMGFNYLPNHGLQDLNPQLLEALGLSEKS